jgi:Phage head-tail joining protein
MFDPSDDLTIVADGTEAVTLLRRGRTPGDAGTVIAHALRRSITAGEAAVVNTGDVRKQVPSGGQQLADDLVWHLPVSELPDAPRLGDVILDGDGRRWTILTIKLATLGVRWRCETRSVGIVAGLDDAISVQKNAGDVSAPIWQTWKTGIRARIQPLSTVIDYSAETPSTTKRYRIFVEENIDLDHTCRIRAADGTFYTILSSTGAAQIGELQVIDVESSTGDGVQSVSSWAEWMAAQPFV